MLEKRRWWGWGGERGEEKSERAKEKGVKGCVGAGVVVMWLQADERGPKEEEKINA